MSVIFRSLQKLKAQAGEECQPALPFKKPRQIPGRRKRRFADLRIVSLVLFIFLSGIGTSYGIYKIRSDSNVPTILTADDPTGRPDSATKARQNPAVGRDPEKESIPPRPDVRYFPAAKKGVDRRDGAPIRTAHLSIPPDAATGPSGIDRAAVKTIAVTAAADRLLVAAKKRPNEDAGPVNEPRGQSIGRMKKSAPKIAQRNVDRSLEINRLVNEIRSCMTAADCRQIDPLFDRLQALKGAHSSYILKLRGYWHLQQNQFESAIGLLQKVLIHDEYDLEANVNMAIAEMRLNRRQRAKHRLAKLREVYPGNAKLAEIWEQLK